MASGVQVVLSASAALTLSDIPFAGPVGAVRVGLTDGQLITNPTYDDMREGLLRLRVVGTADGRVMIDAGASPVQEDPSVDAIEFAPKEIQKITAAISDLAQRAGKPKRPFEAPQVDEAAIAANLPHPVWLVGRHRNADFRGPPSQTAGCGFAA